MRPVRPSLDAGCLGLLKSMGIVATYEMLWDCRSCDSTKLLGLSHRHCPHCGQAQDPTWRYFPPEDEKVAVEDHVNMGADWICPSCDSPNARANGFCGNCGSAPDGARSVVAREAVEAGKQSGTRKDAAPEPTAPAPDPEAGKGCGLATMGCVPLVLIGLLLVFLVSGGICCLGSVWTSDTTLTVSGHAWERSIEIETLRNRGETAWCDELPRGASDIVRSEKKKSTKKVADGQSCKKINVDNGDGTMKQEQRCEPTFKEEPVMAPWCSFNVQRWVVTETKRQNGDRLDVAPQWPTVKTTSCETLGCTKAGKRRESYTVLFVDAEQNKHGCELPEPRWRSLAVQSRHKATKSMVTGSLNCGDLAPL